MNKRGFVNDAYLWLALLFVIGVMIPIVFYLLSQMSTAITDSPASNASGSFMTQFTEDFRVSWDYGFLTIVIASWVGLLVLSWFLQGNPAVFFGILFVILLIGLLGGFLSNAFYTIFASGSLSTIPANMPVLNFIMNNLLTTSIIMMFTMAIVFFAKPGGDGV